MSRRSWNSVAHFASPGLVVGAFGFITTNIGTNPDLTWVWGMGGQTGPDKAPGAANSGPAFVKSIVKTANNGEFLVTLQDGYRGLWHAGGTLYSTSAGPGLADTLDISAPLNEGSGHETPITFLVTTMLDADTPTETSGRRVSVFLVLKDSASGS